MPLLTGLFPGAGTAAGQGSPEKDFWEGTLEEARAAAVSDGRPVLLYFPPARPLQVPGPLRDASLIRKASPRLHLARVRSGEVEKLLALYQVKGVPALFLLDRHGGLVERWEETIPPDFWVDLERALRRLKKSEEEPARALAEARAALEREDHAAALARAREALTRARPGYPEPAAALKIEVQVLSRADAALRKALAKDGIAADPDLLDELRKLRERFPHPLFQDRLDREAERIRARPAGGGLSTAGARGRGRARRRRRSRGAPGRPPPP